MSDGILTFGDIYCGGGGASLGFKQAGFKHLWGIDSDKAACTSYETNIGKAICADAASVDWTILERPDLIWASPPCQGFSVAGKRQKDDPRNFLVWGFVWAVAVLRPRAFVMENVPGVGQGDWAQFPSIIRMALETLGYNVSVFKLNAADMGVPQIRKRVFWAGMLDGWIQVPPPTHAEGGMMGLKPWVTVREALGIRTPFVSSDSNIEKIIGNPSRALTGNEGYNLGPSDFDGTRGPRKMAIPLRMRTQRTATGKAHTPDSDVEGRPSLTLSGEPAFIALPLTHIVDPLTMDTFKRILQLYADATKADPSQVLSLLREATVSQAEAERRFGMLAPFWQKAVLQSAMFRDGKTRTTGDERSLFHRAPQGQGSLERRAVRRVRQNRGRDTPSGPQLGEQCPSQSTAPLPELPSETPPPSATLYALWQTSDGCHLLREALSALQKAWQSISNQNKPIQSPSSYARLSVADCLALQGFPPSFRVLGNKTQQYKQVGNAVPPPVAEALARAVKEAIDG